MGERLNANGARRRKAKRLLKCRGDHVCWICGEPIDMTLDWPDPMSWSCDEYVPRSRGGSQYDAANLREAHLVCNQRRGNRMPAQVPQLFETQVVNSREW